MDYFKNAYRWTLRVLDRLEIVEGNFTDFSEVEDVYNAMMAFVCVGCAGLAAGLTMGLLSLDETKLEIKTMTGTEDEKVAASSILPIIKQHHLLLVTLLLFNAIANETLPIFLGALVPNYIAVILSVTLVLIFGEIIPSALFTGPQQLLTAAKLTKLVYFLLALFYPIAYPISKALDYFFGVEENGGNITRNELEALVVLQGNYKKQQNKLKRSASHAGNQNPNSNNSKSLINYLSSTTVSRDNSISSQRSTDNTRIEKSFKQDEQTLSHSVSESDSDNDEHEHVGLDHNEVALMTGILQLSKRCVRDAMIPMKRVYMMSSSTRLSLKSLYDILECGFSRILVYHRHDKQHLLGYLLVKELIVLNPQDNVMVEELQLREPLFVKPTTGLLEMLDIFKDAHCHLAVVTESPLSTLTRVRSKQRCQTTTELMGIVTLEDIFEKVIQSDIIDETDHQNKQSHVYHQTPTVLYHGMMRPSAYSKSNIYSSHDHSSIHRKHAMTLPKSHQARRKKLRVVSYGSVVSSPAGTRRTRNAINNPAKPRAFYIDQITNLSGETYVTNHTTVGKRNLRYQSNFDIAEINFEEDQHLHDHDHDRNSTSRVPLDDCDEDCEGEDHHSKIHILKSLDKIKDYDQILNSPVHTNHTPTNTASSRRNSKCVIHDPGASELLLDLSSALQGTDVVIDDNRLTLGSNEGIIRRYSRYSADDAKLDSHQHSSAEAHPEKSTPRKENMLSPRETANKDNIVYKKENFNMDCFHEYSYSLDDQRNSPIHSTVINNNSPKRNAITPEDEPNERTRLL